jgi:hypothetical protein
MNIAQSIKLVKKAKPKRQVIPIAVALDPRRWSRAVRSWVGDFQKRDRNESLRSFDSLFKDESATLRHKTEIEVEKESNMALANSKDTDEQTRRERVRAAIEAYPNKSDELRSSERTRVRKGKHLDVDGVLARSYKNVTSISSALDQTEF